VEEAHLRRFARNFAPVRAAVAPPLPVPGMATEAVLVETYEPGAPPARAARRVPAAGRGRAGVRMEAGTARPARSYLHCPARAGRVGLVQATCTPCACMRPGELAFSV